MNINFRRAFSSVVGVLHVVTIIVVLIGIGVVAKRNREKEARPTQSVMVPLEVRELRVGDIVIISRLESTSTDDMPNFPGTYSVQGFSGDDHYSIVHIKMLETGITYGTEVWQLRELSSRLRRLMVVKFVFKGTPEFEELMKKQTSPAGKAPNQGRLPASVSGWYAWARQGLSSAYVATHDMPTLKN